ncbi:MAG: c-type cytochrome [Chloroflexi bacterium]|nr:MAG: c-type cytochrome [Chloroflexota bacterium]
MNTSKQVNVIVGLLFVGALATLLYFIWDPSRQRDAQARQLMENAHFGGALFALNCSSCHGLTGKGATERGGLPGAVLNDDSRRSTSLGEVSSNVARFRDTIHCGRVGTLMPAWSQSEGGSLNDYQIEQLVALITGVMPAQGGSVSQGDIPSDPNALEQSNHRAEFQPLKHLQQGVTASDSKLVFDDASDLKAESRASPSERPLVRIDDDPTDSVYELASVIDAPGGTLLTKETGAQDNELTLVQASVFQAGDVITVDSETMQVVSAPWVTTLADDVTADATTIAVTDAGSLAAGATVKLASEKVKVVSVNGNSLSIERAVENTTATGHPKDTTVTEQGDTIRVERGQRGTVAGKHNVKAEAVEQGNEAIVERGVQGTKASEHRAGTEVFQGPILPPTGPLTGETGTPPCGQKSALPAATPGPPAPITGTVAISLNDNFFDLNGQQNPTMAAKAGDPITVQLTNKGSQPHNMRFAGADSQLDSGDDVVSSPELVPGGATATLSFTTAQPGTYPYRCDFHPDQMKGEITVTQ